MPTVEELRDLEAAAQQDGRSIEDMADDEGTVADMQDDEVYITGSTGQLSLAVGGRKPDSSTFKMKGAEVKVREGQYTKGETVELRVIARIDHVGFQDIHDEYGTVTATKRIHTAKPISVEKIETDDEVS